MPKSHMLSLQESLLDLKHPLSSAFPLPIPGITTISIGLFPLSPHFVGEDEALWVSPLALSGTHRVSSALSLGGRTQLALRPQRSAAPLCCYSCLCITEQGIRLSCLHFLFSLSPPPFLPPS